VVKIKITFTMLPWDVKKNTPGGSFNLGRWSSRVILCNQTLSHNVVSSTPDEGISRNLLCNKNVDL